MNHVLQGTLRAPVTLIGIGVHSGKPARLTLHPADAHHGIVFLRTHLPQNRECLIEARFDKVSATELCTVLGRKDAGVSTIEHLMAALSGLGIDNALIEIDGPELPILDGSSAPFLEAIDQVGIEIIHAPRRFVKVLQRVRVADERGFSELLPTENGFRLDVEIDFKSEHIGRQRKIMDLTPENFRREVSRARTFGFMADVERLWQAGFALGSSLDNTVAIGPEGVVNREGLRYSDEFVRHKMLDAIGDLALAGAPLIGEYRSYCGGHRLNVGVLQALFSDRANYTLIDAAPARQEIAPQAIKRAPQPVFSPQRN